MPTSALLQTYTYEDYKKWEDRWELIDGIAYAMAPAPYPKHQRVVSHVWRELDKNLNCIFKNICEVYISPVDWKVNENTIVQPDVAIFCEKTDKQYFSKKPLLIVEVLSKATAQKDMTVKFDLYEKEGVGSYIMIDPDSKKVEIYELKDDKYKLVKSLQNEGIYDYKDDMCKISIDFKNVFN